MIRFIKTYEGFLDRFKGEYGFRVGNPPKKKCGEKFLSLLEIPVSDIQNLLLEITDVIQVFYNPQDPYSSNDPERDSKFDYGVVLSGFDQLKKPAIHFYIKNDKFIPISIMSTDPKKLAELIDLSEDIFNGGDKFSFNIEFRTKDIYDKELNKRSFFQKIKTVNFNYIPLDESKINIIKECGERICDMIEFEKFELDIEKPVTQNGHSIVKLIFKI